MNETTNNDPAQAVVHLKLPTDEERRKVQSEVERYASHWKSIPALLIVKPDLGLIVSVNTIKCDQHHFALYVTVEDAPVAPEKFDLSQPLILQCVWNQPYMSLSADRINAPYCFYLYFGAKGVRQVREFTTTEVFGSFNNTPAILGMLRKSFLSNHHSG